MPSESGSSGPTMVRPGCSASARRTMASRSFRSTGTQRAILRHAAVAGRANHLRDALAARDRPGQRVFAASGTKDQDFHCSFPSHRHSSKPRKIMVGNGGGGSQTGGGQCRETAFPYTDAGCAEVCSRAGVCEKSTMVETRIKPYDQQVAEQEAREQQRRAFRRNQVFGLVMLAAAICLVVALHTNPKWIFPAGWWRCEDRRTSGARTTSRESANRGGVRDLRAAAGRDSARAHGQRQDGALAGAGRALRRRDCQLRLGGRLSRHGAGHGQAHARGAGARAASPDRRGRAGSAVHRGRVQPTGPGGAPRDCRARAACRL